jgi:Flp pilus assembly protein TadD
VRAFQSYLRLRPASPAGRFFLGRAFASLGMYVPAIRQLREAVRRSPGFAPAHGLLGFAYLKAHRSEQAVDAFRRALELEPMSKSLLAGYLNAALVAAIRLFYKERLVDAAQLFSEVLRHRNDSIAPHLYLSAIYRELGKGNTALFHLEAASALSPQDPILHLQKALVHLEMGQPKQAQEEIRIGKYFLKSAAQVGASPKEVLTFITVRLFMEGRYKEAVFHATRLLKGNYGDVQLHALVAESYRNLGELAKAKNHYLRAMENDRESPELRYGLLAVLWRLGETEEVLAQARRLLHRDPADAMASYFLGLALSRTQEPTEQAIKVLQDQIRARGPDPLLMSALGSVYHRAGLVELAEGWYQRTLKMDAVDGEAYDALRAIYGELGAKDKERDILVRYLSVYPQDSDARRSLVRLLLEAGEFGGAADEIARLLPLEPRKSKLRPMLALCYRRTGRYPEALVLLRDLLREDPGSEELMKAVVYCLDKIGARNTAFGVLGDFLSRQGEKPGLILMLGVLRFQEGDLERSAEAFRRVIAVAPRNWKAHRNLGMVYRKLGRTDSAETFLARAEEYRRAESSPGQ